MDSRVNNTSSFVKKKPEKNVPIIKINTKSFICQLCVYLLFHSMCTCFYILLHAIESELSPDSLGWKMLNFDIWLTKNISDNKTIEPN